MNTKAPDRCGTSGRTLCVSGVSGPLAARETLAQLIAGIEIWNIEDDKLSTIELVAAEVLNNIMEHACRGQEGVPFSVEIDASGIDFGLVFLDEGSALEGSIPNKDIAAAPGPASLEIADLPEGGWGWGLIHAMASHVSYQRDGHINRLKVILFRE